MSKKTESGIGFIGLLQLILITLKLIGQISWVWALVLLPLEIYIGTFLLYLIFALIRDNYKY